MRFIKHALIGIALYEAVKYVLKKEGCGFCFNHDGGQGGAAESQELRRGEVDVIAGANETDQLDGMKENAASGGNSARSSQGLVSQPDATSPDSSDDLMVGTDPEAPLTGKAPDKDDPWKNTLANDDLRAPDS